MLSALIVAFGLVGPQQAPVKPSELVAKMLARYATAPTLKGEILYTQSAAGKSLTGRTEVQYQRPSKIFVNQKVESADLVASRIVSNGSRFLYSLPANLASGDMAADPHQVLVEPVQQEQTLTIAEIYGVGASSLTPRPVPLDIAVGRKQDLMLFKSQIATLQDLGPATVDGQAVRLIGGDWRAYADAPVSAKYQMAITDQGDLVRYVQRELIADPRPNMAPIEVVSTWIARFDLSTPPDPKVFEDQALVIRQAKPKP